MGEIRHGNIILEDSVLAPGVVMIAAIPVQPKTRWRLFGNYSGSSLAEARAAFPDGLDGRGKKMDLVLIAGPTDFRNGYFLEDGSGFSPNPVNKWPYVIDYKLATAVFAHRVSAEYRPHEFQIAQQGSRGHQPLAPHGDASNQANSIALDQFRMMAGITWSSIVLMEVFSGDYKILLPRSRTMVEALCFQCGFGNFMRKATTKMHMASFETRHDLGDTPSIVRRDPDVGFWRPGPNMTSTGGNATPASKWRSRINQFKLARDYFDDNDLGNLKPRHPHFDRPRYVDASIFPPDEIVQ